MEALVREILGILKAIGVNETVYYQLAIFFVGYVFLYFLVFKPYFQVFKKREERTIGNQDLASQALEQTQRLEAEYQEKARELNAQQKKIYNRYREEALSESDEIVKQARLRGKEHIEKIKREIHQKVSTAKEELIREKPHVVEAIVTQILGEKMS